MILGVRAVKAFGPLAPEAFGATNRQTIAIGVSNALLEARESKPHHRVHSGVRGGHNGRSIDNGRTKLCNGSSATRP